MPQLMVYSQLKQSISGQTKEVCSWGKEATLHDRRTLVEDGESRTGGRSTEGVYQSLPVVGRAKAKDHIPSCSSGYDVSIRRSSRACWRHSSRL